MSPITGSVNALILSFLITITCSAKIVCDESNLCFNSTNELQCTDGEECTVQCLTANICDNAQIVCPQNNDCTFICGATCNNIQIIATNTTETLKILCDNSSCQYLTVNASHVTNLQFTQQMATSYDPNTIPSGIAIFAEHVTNTTSISCLGDYACDEAVIYAEHSNRVEISANGAYVLRYASIDARHASSFTISCISPDDIGCNNPTLHLPVSPSSHIAFNCIGIGCQSMVLYAVNGFRDIDTLTLDGCDSCTNIGGDESDDCIFEWSMYCGDQYSQSTTIWGSYCSNDQCGCMDDGLNLMETAWQNTDLVCDAYSNAQLVLDEYLEYDIDCSLGEYTCNAYGDLTATTLVNGVGAKSLSISCANNQDCGPLVVYCPVDGACNIHCDGDQSCQDASIYFSNNDNKLNVYCTASSSCKSMEIHAFNASAVEVHCLNENACHSLKVFATKASVIDVRCDSDAAIDSYLKSPCYAVEIYGEYANVIALQCQSACACFATYLYAENAQNLVISARETHGLYEPHIYAQNVNNFTLQCVGNSEGNGCYQPRLWIDGSNTNIHCVGFGCQYMTIVGEDNADSVRSITMSGQCDSCNSIDSCVGQWELNCNQHDDNFNGRKCDSNDCGCNALWLKTQRGWIEDSACMEAITTDEGTSNEQKEENGGGVAVWVTVITIVLAVAIVFAVVLCGRSWYIRKQQQHHLRQINLVRVQKDAEDKKNKKKNSKAKDSVRDDEEESEDERGMADEEIARAAPVSSMSLSASGNLEKASIDATKPNAAYKKMVDQLDHFDYEEGR